MKGFKKVIIKGKVYLDLHTCEDGRLYAYCLHAIPAERYVLVWPQPQILS